jgi:hypothetical protein
VSFKSSCAVLSAFLFVAQALFAQGSTSGGPATSTSSTGATGSTNGGPGATAACAAPTRQISLHIPDESAPPGGIVQMKVLVTEPTPVSSGGPRVPVPTGSIPRGIQLFNPNGDVNGVAMVGPQMVTIASVTSTGTQGSDYPIMIISLQLPPTISVGTKLPFSLDPSSTWTLGLLGTATLKPFPPATITVGGSISITDVVPGGGIQPAGTVVSVQGMGFQAGTQVQLSNIKASSITVVSPQEIQIVLAEPTQMTGKKMQVTNPDGSNDTYFSYMRGIPLGQSEQPLLASAVPIFSSATYSQAVFSSGDAGIGEFSGIAVQNPNLAPATVTFNLFSVSNVPLGGSTIVVPGGYRMMRDMSEVTGVAPPPGSYLAISSDAPVQTFGFLGDAATGTVLPYVALSSQP